MRLSLTHKICGAAGAALAVLILVPLAAWPATGPLLKSVASRTYPREVWAAPQSGNEMNATVLQAPSTISRESVLSIAVMALSFMAVANDVFGRRRAKEELRREQYEREEHVEERTAHLRQALEALRRENVEQRRALEAVRRTADATRNLNLHIEQRLSDRTTQLEAVHRQFEAFGDSVAHNARDLLVPLGAIDGLGQTLIEGYEQCLDEPGCDMLRRIDASAQDMRRLIDDVLALAQVSHGPLSGEPGELTAVALVRQNSP
jgi:signal transduction histidine kinase